MQFGTFAFIVQNAYVQELRNDGGRRGGGENGPPTSMAISDSYG